MWPGLLLALQLVIPNHLVAPVPTTALSTIRASILGSLTAAPQTETAIPQPKTAAVAVTMPTQAQPLTFATLPAPWRCIAYYESTNNLTAVNPVSGTEGAFQFAQTTWAAFAPSSFPASPLDASLSQQLTVAENIAAVQGFTPWETAPLCGE
jgi:hypothetical protein